MINNGVFFGLATVDIIHYVPQFPLVNQKIKSERVLSFAGGPATNAAVTFSAFGNNAMLVTGVGEHFMGNLIREELAHYNVGLKDYTDQASRQPVIASVIVELSTGSRTVVYSNTDMRRLKKEAANRGLLENRDILLLDGHYLEQAIPLAQMAKELDLITVLDGGSWKEGLEDLFPYIDYIICSEDFLGPDCDSHTGTAQLLQSHGLRHIAFTRGEKPVLVYIDGEKSEIPVMEEEIIDSLGSGDIFHGAFCHYILHHDYETSLRRAAEVASFSCSSLGPRSWIEQEKFL